MKRLIVVFTFILFNLFSAYYWFFYESEKNEFKDEVMTVIGDQLQKEMQGLLKETEANFKSLRNDCSSFNFDFETCNSYFLQYFDNNKLSRSFLLKKNQFKFLIQQDQDSYISAFDSTQNIDVVNWKRFVNGKEISQWNEIFSDDDYQLQWINDLGKESEDFFWTDKVLSQNNQSNLIIGESWIEGSNHWTLLSRFSYQTLRDRLSFLKSYEVFRVILETSNNQMIFLSNNLSGSADTIIDSDSFRQFYKAKFLENEKETLVTFRFNERNTWAAIRPIDGSLNIKKVIISMPESSIQSIQETDQLSDIFFFILGLIISFFAIWFIFRPKTFKRASISATSSLSINDILEENENRYLEFKSSLRWDYKQEKVNPDLEFVIIKTIAAFGNSDGGTLLIGVDDDKQILGLGADYQTLKKPGADYFEIYSRNLFHKYFGVKYTTKNIRMSFLKDNTKEVCMVEVFKANEPVYIKYKDKSGLMGEKFFVRSGNSSQQIDSLKDINDYIYERFKKKD
ncbi:MAG: ATP-binding protein [Bacteroidales bacterium]|nr:ATP-binding protein [Bacteroidales bacterium]